MRGLGRYRDHTPPKAVLTTQINEDYTQPKINRGMKGLQLGKFTLRLRLCWQLLTDRHPHFIFVTLSPDDVRQSLKEEGFGAKFVYHGLQRYNTKVILKNIGETVDELQMALDKAQFEAGAEGLL